MRVQVLHGGTYSRYSTATRSWHLNITSLRSTFISRSLHASTVSIARAGIRLPEIPRDRREDQQDQVVQATEPGPFPALYQWFVI
jgi:hypothetical protein